MSLEVNHGDEVEVAAEGPDADTAVDTIAAALATGLGEAGAAVASPAAAARVTTPEVGRAPRPASASPDVLVGVSASSGLAIGRVVQFRRSEVSVPEHAASPGDERARLASAIAAAKHQL